MAEIKEDHRFKFGKVQLPGSSGALLVRVDGGPVGRVFVMICDASDKILNGLGFDPFEPPLITAAGGEVGWAFPNDSKAAYIKWGVQAVRNAANLTAYTVISSLCDSAGNVLAQGSYKGEVPGFEGEIQWDGAKFAAAAVVPTGPSL